jgi:GNAT superfamily N-acetyltransferase
MELDHMSRDGTLYILELYATAVQQEVYGGSNLLSELQKAINEYNEFDRDDLVDSLRYPVLMVSLWENQREGLKKWLSADRHGVLEMATATGKTVAGIGAIAHLCGVLPNHNFDVWGADERTEDASIAVIAHSIAILSQWEREIRDLLGLNVAGVVIRTNLYHGRHAWVHDLVVDEPVRGEGHGARLLRWVFEWADDRDCSCVELASGTWRDDAHRFYERVGMEEYCLTFKRDLDAEALY